MIPSITYNYGYTRSIQLHNHEFIIIAFCIASCDLIASAFVQPSPLPICSCDSSSWSATVPIQWSHSSTPLWNPGSAPEINVTTNVEVLIRKVLKWKPRDCDRSSNFYINANNHMIYVADMDDQLKYIAILAPSLCWKENLSKYYWMCNVLIADPLPS